MDAVSSIKDKLFGNFQIIVRRVRQQILGNNNERLDFILDSFYRLNPSQKNAVVGGFLGGLVVVVLIIVAIYFNSVGNLEKSLEESQSAHSQLKVQMQSYQQEIANYNSLVERISSKTEALRIKPFFEQLFRKHGLEMDNLNEKLLPLPIENALSDKFQEVRADIRLNKISIPKLLKLLVAIESSNNFLKVDELKIQSRHEDKLYFDAKFRVTGYQRK